VLVAARGSGDVTVLINHGGTLTAELVLPVGSQPMGVAFAAIDATCGLDIAVSSKDAGDVLVIPSVGK